MVVEFLSQVFYMFGPPIVLQSDNGGEFRGNELAEFLRKNFPYVKHIFSRPRHPESNGLIERANQTLENRIQSWVQENGGSSDGWADALPQIALVINTTWTRTIKATPFEVLLEYLEE